MGEHPLRHEDYLATAEENRRLVKEVERLKEANRQLFIAQEGAWMLRKPPFWFVLLIGFSIVVTTSAIVTVLRQFIF